MFYDRVGLSDLSALRAEPDGLDQDEMVQIFCQNMEVSGCRGDGEGDEGESEGGGVFMTRIAVVVWP